MTGANHKHLKGGISDIFFQFFTTWYIDKYQAITRLLQFLWCRNLLNLMVDNNEKLSYRYLKNHLFHSTNQYWDLLSQNFNIFKAVLEFLIKTTFYMFRPVTQQSVGLLKFRCHFQFLRQIASRNLQYTFLIINFQTERKTCSIWNVWVLISLRSA